MYFSEVRTPEDDPFCYLQGSHKANYPWFIGAEGGDTPALTKKNFPSLEVVFAEPGDAVLLNEALLHGTLPKTSDRERIVLAFSYAPAFVSRTGRRSTCARRTSTSSGTTEPAATPRHRGLAGTARGTRAPRRRCHGRRKSADRRPSG